MPLPVRRRRGLGVVAFIASAAATILGAAGIVLAAISVRRVLRFTDYPDLVQDTEAQMWDTLERAIGAVVILVIAWIVHALIALWGLIQGIVATALGRGRGWGIAAIIIASTSWMFLVWLMQEALVIGLLGIVPFVG